MVRVNNFGRSKKVYDSLFLEVLKSVKPDYSVVDKCNLVVKLINDKIKRLGVNAAAVLGGSIAKKTFLKGDYDCDVFVKFDYGEFKSKDDVLSDVLERVLKGFEPLRVHGSRDYFQFFKDGIKFEVVPVLNIKNPKDALNVMDVSPLHVLWFKKHSDEMICDSVRLAKLFCKAQEIYGAESFVKGFSGHVLDILIVYYGSFLRLLKAASSDWKRKFEKHEKIIVDVENFYKGKALFNINKSKIQGPLVVVDPVQKERNAAASLSEKNLRVFIRAASKFLKNPSKSFFKVKVFDENKLINSALKNKRPLVIVKAMPLKKSVDVAGCKLLKAYDFIVNNMLKNDFQVIKKGFYWSKKLEEPAVFYFFIKDAVLEEDFVIKGPPVKMKSAVKNFVRKHKKTFVKGGFVFAIEKRKFRRAVDLLKHLLNSDYVKTRTSKFEFFTFNF